jgi:hypothetical protein
VRHPLLPLATCINHRPFHWNVATETGARSIRPRIERPEIPFEELVLIRLRQA